MTRAAPQTGPLAGKRIGLLSAWLSPRNGGVFEAVAAQAALIRAAGGTPVLVGLRDDAPLGGAAAPVLQGFETHALDGSGPAALAFARGMTARLAAAELDLLHLHGIWQYAVAAAGSWRRHGGRPLVVSPHGMMDPWITARGRWRKHVARLAWERRGWRRADLFHALTADEARDIVRETHAPVAVIPNPAPPPCAPPAREPGPVALFVGRVHAKKNLETLVAAWRAIRPRLPAEARLIVAGWGAAGDVAALEAALAVPPDSGVLFVGAAFGSQKAALMDHARVVVLPSLSEGLPMAILEAWAAGIPTVMTDACHLPEGFAAGAALRCGPDAASIGEALATALTLRPERLEAMRAAARTLATGPFGADTVRGRWEQTYARLMAGEAPVAS